MREEYRALLLVIKSILNKKSSSCADGITDIDGLVPLAKSHNLMVYLFFFCERRADKGIVSAKTMEYIEECNTQQLAQCIQQIYAIEEMQNAFEQNHIYNMPLKGSCTNRLYPDESLRAMGDVDILVMENQNSDVRKVMESLGYGGFREGRKHDVFRRKPFITVETHRNMVAAESKYASYYGDIWDKCSPKVGYEYCYEMRVEDEFLFNIIHLVEHLMEGGVGIRFIMDVYLYDNLEMDRSYFEAELDKVGLLDFYHNISLLAKMWFDDEPVEMDGDKHRLIDRLESFILSNGNERIRENAADLAVYNGRVLCAFKNLFPSYHAMCTMFPWLRGKMLLLPYSWCIRGIRCVLHRPENARYQLNVLRKGNASNGRKLVRFYHECGL